MGKDDSIIIKLINEYDEISFCKYFILNQLVNPNLNIDDLDNLNLSEIQFILNSFIKHDDFLFNIISLENDNNFFINFKKGFLDYFLGYKSMALEAMIHLDKLKQPYQSSVISMMKTLEQLDFSNQFDMANAYFKKNQKIIKSQQEALILASNSFYKNEKTINQMANKLVQINDSLMPYFKSAIPQLKSISNVISSISYISDLSELLLPQIDMWSNWRSNNQKILDFYYQSLENWNNFLEEYHIRESTAINYLKKYHWFISPSMDISVVNDIILIAESNSNHKSSKINKLFYDYFIKNECENLDDMLDYWSHNIVFKKRMKIFRDSVNLIKLNEKNINPSNLIVPTLIAQIDGIQNDFMATNNLTVKFNKIYDADGNKLKDNHGQNIHLKQYFRNLTSQDEFLDAMNDVFLDVLFQDTMPGEEYKTSIHFSRHKILHGENFRYGRKDYMIRCFMILDFLNELCLTA